MFSAQAALIARHTFNLPEDVVTILDGASRPEGAAERERKRAKGQKIETCAYKLDQVAPWKEWGSVAGVKLKGMRHLPSAKVSIAV